MKLNELDTFPELGNTIVLDGNVYVKKQEDDVCNWNLTVGGLKDYDHVYVNGVRYVEFQPDINIQYLLDQVSRLTAENAMLKEKGSAPKREPLTRQQISEGNQSMFNVTRDAFVMGVKWAEKAHGIGGEI